MNPERHKRVMFRVKQGAAHAKLGRTQEEKAGVGMQAGEVRNLGNAAGQGRPGPSKQEAGPGASDSRPGSQGAPFSGLVLATYTLDFGLVLAGTQKVGKLVISP